MSSLNTWDFLERSCHKQAHTGNNEPRTRHQENNAKEMELAWACSENGQANATKTCSTDGPRNDSPRCAADRPSGDDDPAML